MRLDHVRRAIAFGAHPDDVEVGAGGLVAKLVEAGTRVTIVASSIPNQYEVRRAEAIAAAAILGASLVLPPDAGATRLEDIKPSVLVARFERELAAADPEVVIVHGAHDSHHDHLAVHRAVLAALRRTRCDILAYATRLPAGGTAPAPTCVLDISKTIDKKLAAIAEHRSQFPPDFLEKRRAIHRALGITHSMSYAEVYEVVRIEL